MYTRIQDNCKQVQLEESPCLGACKMGPCVAVEHDDYVGPVGLIGMTESEIDDSVFYNVVTSDDADRVWTSIEYSIYTLMEEEEEKEQTENEEDNE